MKNFLKPTKVTWTVLGVILLIVTLGPLIVIGILSSSDFVSNISNFKGFSLRDVGKIFLIFVFVYLYASFVSWIWYKMIHRLSMLKKIFRSATKEQLHWLSKFFIIGVSLILVVNLIAYFFSSVFKMN